MALSACATGSLPQAGDVALPEAFHFGPSAGREANVAALLPGEDPAFRALAQAALDNAPDLSAALARVEVARAAADRAGAELLPAIDASASIERSRINPEQFGTNLPAAVGIDRTRTVFGANFEARWDPDLFGGLKARGRAARARLDASSADAAAVRLALLAEIAGTVIDWRTLAARQAALAEDFEAAQELARLAGVREDAGIAPGFDRLRAQAAAAASRSRMAALDSARALLTGRLVTLTALPASDVLAALAQPSSEPLGRETQPPPQVPSILLANRPDIHAAAARLAAADAEVAAAAAARFPRILLSGTLGWLAFDAEKMFEDDSFVGGVGAQLVGPLLDFGRVSAEIRLAKASVREAFEHYRGAVFTALGDAEAAYALVAAVDHEAQAAIAEADQAHRAARLSEFRFRAGLADFLTVLEARRSADASGERAAAARGRAARARVLLWQALGGEPPERAES